MAWSGGERRRQPRGPALHVYRAVRGAHLLATAALVPLGVWHWLSTHPGTAGPALFVIFVASVLTTLFAVTLDQADYPVTLRGALLITTPMLANYALAAWAQGDVFSAAAWTVSAMLAALTVVLAVVTAIGLRRRGSPAARKLLVGFFVPAALLAGGAAVIVALPLASRQQLAATDQVAAAALSVGAWLGHTAATARAWFDMSVFSDYIATQRSIDRRESFNAWGGAAAVALLVSLCAVVFVLALA